MKYTILAALLAGLSITSIFAQQSVPELPLVSVPDPLKLPADIH